MCFYTESDWYASVCDVTRPVATKTVACDECRRRILPGEEYVNIYQQERETCRNCEFDDEADDPEDLGEEENAERCPEGECDFGETFDYDRCVQCDQALRAIEAVELSRGCKAQHALPALTQLYEAMWEADEDGAYAAKALEMFPHLRGHLWRLKGEPEAVGVRGDPFHEFGGEG